MGELINGRTPKAIKIGLHNMLEACGEICGEDTRCLHDICPYYGDNGCNESIQMDAIAYIERLEVALKCEQVARDVLMEDIPKWISVKERLPEEVCRCLVITKRHEESSMVNTATYNHMGWWTHGNFGEITHWMPLPQPPEEEVCLDK